MRPFDPIVLSEPLTAVAIRSVVNELGELAGYMLRDGVYGTGSVKATRPTIPSHVGCCWPVIGVRESDWTQFMLPAFVLPLQWNEDGQHDQRLPPAIIDCAKHVLEKLLGKTDANYSISFVNREQLWPDLSWFDKRFIEAESCFASLATGLESRRQGTRPDSRVWSSAVWSGGFKSVEMLDKKMVTAKRWNATSFFVANDQSVSQESESESESTLELKRLGLNFENGPAKSLAPLFAASAVEPDSSDWEACRHFHNAIRTYDQKRANEYYDRVLYRHILKHCKKTIRSGASLVRPVTATHMVTIATNATQPVRVLVGTFEVQHLLILYTDGPSNMRQSAIAIQRQCQSLLSEASPAPIPFYYDSTLPNFPSDFSQQLAAIIANFIHGIDESQVIFDIDRGTTMHKIALLRGIIRPNNLIATLSHQQQSGNLIDHGTEQVFVWRNLDEWQGARVLSDCNGDSARALDSSSPTDPERNTSSLSHSHSQVRTSSGARRDTSIACNHKTTANELE